MPTNEERREIAAKLRELVRFSDFGVYHATSICNVLGLIDINRYAPSEYYSGDGVMHLADIIDPDPERTCIKTSHNTGCYNMKCFSCSECNFGWFEDVNDIPFHYCPYCGAKVAGEWAFT